jgi:cytochrome P450
MTRELFHYISPFVFFRVKLFGRFPTFTPLYFKYKKLVKSWDELSDNIVKESFEDYVTSNNIIKHLAKSYNFHTYAQLDQDMKKHLQSIAVASITAGNDSTDGTLLQIGVIFSLYPMLVTKMQDEIKSKIGSRVPNYQDIANLTYVRAVLKEILRLSPPMTIAPRTCLNDDMVAGYKVKKGEIVIIPCYALQRDARYWKNPLGFDPDRFLQPLTDDQRLVYMPFSLGERSCLGASYAMVEITLIITLMLQRYRFELVPGCSLAREPGLENRLNPDIMMRIYNI